MPDDTPIVARVLYESFVEYESLYTPQGFEGTVLDEQQVLARMQEGPLWIALLESDVVGTVAAVVKAESLYVRGMAVVPYARRLKVAAMLLDQAECFAAERHCTRIFLSTTPFLNAAIRFYERSGYQRVQGGSHDLFGTPLFVMEKYIPF
jgi:GNAT superfamily N-acetyltransferase